MMNCVYNHYKFHILTNCRKLRNLHEYGKISAVQAFSRREGVAAMRARQGPAKAASPRAVGRLKYSAPFLAQYPARRRGENFLSAMARARVGRGPGRAEGSNRSGALERKSRRIVFSRRDGRPRWRRHIPAPFAAKGSSFSIQGQSIENDIMRKGVDHE